MGDQAGEWTPYWVTLRLILSAESQWARFDGWCASLGIEPLELAPDRFLNLIYYWLVRYADEAEQGKIDRQLWMPPVGYTGPITEGPWTAEAEMAAFNAFAAELNVRPVGGTIPE